MGEIMHAVNLAVCHQSRMKIHQFLVVDIGEDNLILGYPFFEAANPFIDWQWGSANGNVTLTTCDEWVQAIPRWKEGDELWERKPTIKATATAAQQFAESAMNEGTGLAMNNGKKT
jgi:hypothetical protein